MIYNILVVDDDAAQAEMMSKLIADKMHYHTQVAHNGIEAIDILNANNEIDLVILDLAMPGIDGVEVLHQVKPLKPDLPFIIRSGYEDTTKVVEAMKAGAVDYIRKIDHVNHLCASIERVLPKPKATPVHQASTLEQVEALLLEQTSYILNLQDPQGNLKTLTEIEKEVILQALKRYRYHMSKVAQHLGIGRSTLYRKLDEYHLHPRNDNYDA